MISVANRVIAIGYQSVIAVWRVKAQSRRVEASAFYRSTTQKRKPKFSTVCSTVERNLAANGAILCNGVRTLMVYNTQHPKGCAKQRNAAQFVRLELQISCSTR
jgi:hypothetical protein